MAKRPGKVFFPEGGDSSGGSSDEEDKKSPVKEAVKESEPSLINTETTASSVPVVEEKIVVQNV